MSKKWAERSTVGAIASSSTVTSGMPFVIGLKLSVTATDKASSDVEPKPLVVSTVAVALT